MAEIAMLNTYLWALLKAVQIEPDPMDLANSYPMILQIANNTLLRAVGLLLRRNTPKEDDRSNTE